MVINPLDIIRGEFMFNNFFDGLGTELVSVLIGLFVGGIGGYYVCKHKIKQSQNGGDKSKQRQKAEINSICEGTFTEKSNITQKQKGGNGADQEQIGRKNVR